MTNSLEKSLHKIFPFMETLTPADFKEERVVLFNDSHYVVNISLHYHHNSQIGMMTPPFGMNIFVCMRVANMGMGKVVKSTMPYLILLIIATLVISFIPEISMFVPNLLAS